MNIIETKLQEFDEVFGSAVPDEKGRPLTYWGGKENNMQEEIREQKVDKLFEERYEHHTIGVSRAIKERTGEVWLDSMEQELQEAFLEFGDKVWDLALQAQRDEIVEEIGKMIPDNHGALMMRENVINLINNK